jgi:hypothetical protein
LANTRAMPLPMPLLAPVTMTDRPVMDVNMSDLPRFSFVRRMAALRQTC